MSGWLLNMLGPVTQKVLTGVLDISDFWVFFPPHNVLWKLAHSEGEIVFDRFCDLGFHRFALLNGPGALGAREERAAECF